MSSNNDTRMTFGPRTPPPHDPHLSLGCHVTPELVAALEALYPDRFPAEWNTERDLLIGAGQLQVVRLLRQSMEAAREAGIIANGGRLI
jgi:hypothetical protein